MENDNGAASVPLNEGYKPIEKGWKPTVQGGYKPAASDVVASPPKGGSGIKAPPPPRQ